jgi:hypothetical protein
MTTRCAGIARPIESLTAAHRRYRAAQRRSHRAPKLPNSRPIESLSATHRRYRAGQRRSHRACEQFPRSLLLASSIMSEDRRWTNDAETLNTWSPSAA